MTRTKSHTKAVLPSIVFTGHMIDLPGRSVPRFPQSVEDPVRFAIRRLLVPLTGITNQSVAGFASCARGGDILFHEECRHIGLRTKIVLPFRPNNFEQTSVAGIIDSNWVERFRRLWRETPHEDREIMNLPVTDEAFALCNTRLVTLAQEEGPYHLIALWDGLTGDGPGGTADMVAKARGQGDEPDIINPHALVA